MDRIDQDTYSTIHKLMPIICIDVVVICEGEILLIKRSKKPAQGQYWFPGGRLYKNESAHQAARRIVKTETNLNLLNPSFIGHDETMFKTDPFEHGKGTHTVNLVFASKIKSMDLISLMIDDNHSTSEFFKPEFIYDKENDIHQYIKKFVVLATSTLGGFSVAQT